MTAKEFIQNAETSTLPFFEYVEKLPHKTFLYTTELIDEIECSRKNQDESLLEDLLIIADRDGLDTRYTKPLNQLLNEDWHHSHEDIAMMLEDIKDPSSIDSLFRAANTIPNYDDGRSLAKKCIWALAAINTIESKEKIKLLSNSFDPIISEFATDQLKEM